VDSGDSGVAAFEGSEKDPRPEGAQHLLDAVHFGVGSPEDKRVAGKEFR
jgi:hypothetical protein